MKDGLHAGARRTVTVPMAANLRGAAVSPGGEARIQHCEPTSSKAIAGLNGTLTNQPRNPVIFLEIQVGPRDVRLEVARVYLAGICPGPIQFP